MTTFKANITLQVSEQNQSLIPLLVNKNDILSEGETHNEAVLRILKHRLTFLLKDEMILSRLVPYFGEAGQEITDSIKESLENGALTVETSVIE